MAIDRVMLREALELTIRARDRLVAALDLGAGSGTQPAAADTCVLIQKIGDTFFSHMPAAPGLCGMGRSREEAEVAILPAQIGLLKSDPSASALTPYEHICRADALLHAAYDTPCEPGDETWHKRQAHGLIHDAAAHLSPDPLIREVAAKEAAERSDLFDSGRRRGHDEMRERCSQVASSELKSSDYRGALVAAILAAQVEVSAPGKRDSAQEIAP